MRPKMVLFDYGGTLLYEESFSPRKANEALFSLISSNPHDISVDEFTETLEEKFASARAKSGDLIEVHEHIFLRYMLEYFDLQLSVPIEEAEWAMFNAISHSQKTPGADEMLNKLKEMGIRSGIISNLCWSGAALSRRIRETFPSHEFEFHNDIFRIHIQKTM